MVRSTPKDFDYHQLQQHLDAAHDDPTLFQKIVNSPFTNKYQTTLLGLGIIVFLLVNKPNGTIDRIALSDTELAHGAVNISAKPFASIKIPIHHKTNIIANAISSGRPRHTDDWRYLFEPDLTPEQARFNQAGAGISCSYVYPFSARDGGALIFSFYESPDKIGPAHKQFMKKYSRMVANSLQA